MRNGILDDLGPMYHSYHIFGVKNAQLPGHFKKNQKVKEPIIGGYMLSAIGKCRCGVDDPVSFVELFCADGYYAMLARHFGATISEGIDNNKDGFSSVAREIASRLEISNCTFLHADVNVIEGSEQYDIVANVGGLYHVDNPEEILDKSYRMAKKFLIVQTVVSIANDDPHYFESPAPGWSWGNRYSRSSFWKTLVKRGWNVVDTHFNLLEGNDRPEDMGSFYALISKKPARGFSAALPRLRKWKACLGL